MKKILTLATLFVSFIAHSQLLSWSPDFIQETSNNVTITMNANYGNKGLLNYTPTSDVYVHFGVITNKSASSGDWKYVRSVWATTYSWERATYIGNNQWQFTIDTTASGGLRKYFGMTDTSEHIQKIAILFRNGAGTSVQRNESGDDMFVPVYGSGLYARVDNPFRQPEFTPIIQPITETVGSTLPIVGKSSLAGSTLKLYFNGKLLSTLKATKDSISTTITATGTQTVVARASKAGYTTVSDTLIFYIAPSNTIAPLPKGVTDGINYLKGDSSVTLVLFAPNKSHIVVLGDFNNWKPSPIYQMKETSDLQRYWLTIKGLSPGVEYAYQYQIDDTLQVADYNTQKVLDKHVDSMISSATYPNLRAFPTEAAGNLASVIQTGQASYKWKIRTFARPDKRNLVIYELLMRDFTAAENWQTVQDTLTYLKRLGVNAIEVMPFCNFEGYSSWGYNPNFYFAPDNVYGTATNLKKFVDACHQDGIAVIMDLAMQDVYGSSPLASMYWNSFASIPATNNPWLDQYPTHAYNEASQFNHASAATIALRKRVYAYWLDSFHLDGFRFDLAGGYTQTNTCGTNGTNCNVTEWNYYDQNRVNTLDSVYAEEQAISPGSYSILEIFVATTEEATYVNNGQLVWSVGDQNSTFTQSTMGFPTTNGDFSGGLYTNTSGWTQPGEVTYMESHDETVGSDERVMFKNENYGNSSGSYNAKDTATALLRTGMAAAFWSMMPGPKMMWMFEELGYDYSPDACANGGDSCGNIDPKPIRWDYQKQANRAGLYNVYSKLLNLRNTSNYLNTFTTGSTNKDFSSYIKWMSVYSDSLQVMVMGNFDVNQQTYTVSFPSAGTWYNLFTGKDTTVASTAYTSVTMAAGQYAVYVNRKVSGLSGAEEPLGLQNPVVNTSQALWKVYPNPATSNTYFHAQSNLGRVQMQLLDMSGRVLYNYTSANMPNGSQAAIPVSGLARGMYFLKINSDKSSGTEKILVQ